MTATLEPLIEDYLDGNLDADGAATLVAALQANGSAALAIRERIALAGLLGLALDPVDGTAVARGVSERLRAVDGSAAFGHELRRRLARQPARRARPPNRSIWPVGLSAAALLLVGMALWLTQRTAAPAAWTVAVGSAASADLANGTRLALTTGGHLDGADGTRLDCQPGTTIEFLETATGSHFTLLGGSLTASVAPQPVDRPLAIITPEVHIAVVGTRFTVSRDTSGTRLAMASGTVRLNRLLTGTEELVHGGATVSIAAATMPTPAAAEPAWRPLFARTDLHGWSIVSGTWSNTDGVIHGEATDGLRSRLETVEPLTDLELTCRIRISGGRTGAEIQVGDYNWFVQIPAAADSGWIAIRFRQQGTLITATADGRPLVVEAGDGKPPRPGKLGFYVGTGGSLDITDGQLRSWPMPTSAP